MPGTNEYSAPRNRCGFPSFLSTHTHRHTTRRAEGYHFLIRLGVFAPAQNAIGTNKTAGHSFMVLHLGVFAHACWSVERVCKRGFYVGAFPTAQFVYI